MIAIDKSDDEPEQPMSPRWQFVFMIGGILGGITLCVAVLAFWHDKYFG